MSFLGKHAKIFGWKGFFYENQVNSSEIKDILINLKDIKDIKGHFCPNKGHKGHFFKIKDIKDIVATLYKQIGK